MLQRVCWMCGEQPQLVCENAGNLGVCVCVCVCVCVTVDRCAWRRRGVDSMGMQRAREGDPLGDPERRKRVKGNGREGKVSGWQRK